LAHAQGEVRLTPREAWSAAFAESKVESNYTIASQQPFQGTLGWSLHIDERIVSRGEVAVDSAPDRPAKATVRLAMPAVRHGVIQQATLSVEVHAGDASKAVAKLERTIWIYPEDVFADRSAWLAGLKITLFDPQQQTSERFSKAGIPFRLARTAVALSETREGLVIVGEEVSLATQRDLAETLVRLAEAGRAVLCLAPAEGRWPLPDGEQPDDRRPVLMLRGNEMIGELDKRLDAEAWLGVEQPVRSRLNWKVDRSGLGLAVSTGQGWPWLELRYPHSGGRLLICGYAIVRDWESGPTPRYLLSRILERLSETSIAQAN
jgi:hypothetical protein